jgi:hypothetical protein
MYDKSIQELCSPDSKSSLSARFLSLSVELLSVSNFHNYSFLYICNMWGHNTSSQSVWPTQAYINYQNLSNVSPIPLHLDGQGPIRPDFAAAAAASGSVAGPPPTLYSVPSSNSTAYYPYAMNSMSANNDDSETAFALMKLRESLKRKRELRRRIVQACRSVDEDDIVDRAEQITAQMQCLVSMMESAKTHRHEEDLATRLIKLEAKAENGCSYGPTTGHHQQYHAGENVGMHANQLQHDLPIDAANVVNTAQLEATERLQKLMADMNEAKQREAAEQQWRQTLAAIDPGGDATGAGTGSNAYTGVAASPPGPTGAPAFDMEQFQRLLNGDIDADNDDSNNDDDNDDVHNDERASAKPKTKEQLMEEYLADVADQSRLLFRKPKGKSRFRAIVCAMQFLIRSKRQCIMREVTFKHRITKNFKNGLGVYIDLMRRWIKPAFKLAVISVLKDPKMELQLTKHKISLFRKVSNRTLEKRLLQIRVRTRSMCHNLVDMLDDEDRPFPSALVSFCEEYLLVERTHFPDVRTQTIGMMNGQPADPHSELQPYLLPSEMHQLEFDGYGAACNLAPFHHQMLCMNLFLTRVGISLILRPHEMGIRMPQIKHASSNLRIIASVMYAAVRLALAELHPADIAAAEHFTDPAILAQLEPDDSETMIQAVDVIHECKFLILQWIHSLHVLLQRTINRRQEEAAQQGDSRSPRNRRRRSSIISPPGSPSPVNALASVSASATGPMFSFGATIADAEPLNQNDDAVSLHSNENHGRDSATDEVTVNEAAHNFAKVSVLAGDDIAEAAIRSKPTVPYEPESIVESDGDGDDDDDDA